ncbi:MAG TPA: S41 family peptidase [Pyrinomonadaceae bacterium]|nr:S41 family peptidase [Pyrinomonadaceae bacterium]
MKHHRPYTHCLTVVLICLAFITEPDVGAQTSPARPPAMQTSLANPDFELGNVGQLPDGWTSSTAKIGYPAEVVEENPKTGKRAALVRSVDGAQIEARAFGNLMQAIDATQFRGHRVRFRAAVRMEGGDPVARAQLWLRADRPEKQVGFFNNMDDRPIRSGAWQYYEIVGDIDDDATVVNIGMMLIGKGKAWLDDVSLVDLGKPVTLAEPARPLTGKGLENLIVFTRLLGYVRHFHPSDEALATDWDIFTVEGVRIAEGAKDASDLALKLETFFRPVAPTLRVFPTGKRPGPIAVLMPQREPSIKAVSYRHRGFGQKTAQLFNIYQMERVVKDLPGGKAPADFPDPLKPFTANLEGGVSVAMPLALYMDAKGTIPHGAAKISGEAPLVKYSGNDRATRLTNIALAWNIFQHFYPYFDAVKTDWPLALKEALTAAATDSNEKAFLNTLKHMVAQLHDGHGGVYHASDQPAFATPAIFGWVEDRLVVTQVASPAASELQPGDVILKIDGKDAAEALAEAEKFISGATPQWRRQISLRRLRMGEKDSELKLEVQPRAGNSRTVLLRRDSESLTLRETRPPQVSEVKPGIFYLDLDRIKDEDFKAILPKLEQARGIVFDLRGYPQVSPMVISHLIDKPVESARWLVPIVTAPDQGGAPVFDERGRWNLPPVAPRLTAKIAFITDGRAISYAESFMGIIEAYKLAEIVGEPTAGTNGNVNPFMLPGNYRVVWTGMKVLKHDGSKHHGVGIQPTVPVSRTIRGISEMRDEQLERAIAVVSQ